MSKAYEIISWDKERSEGKEKENQIANQQTRENHWVETAAGRY